MAHEFESGFFGGRQAAWHQLGNVIEEDVLTAQDAILAAGLDWEVALVPVYARFGDSLIEIPGKQGVQRDRDGSILGVVGEKYVPVQNAEAFTFMDDLVDSGEAKFHTAGSLRFGQRVWMLAKVSKDILIAGLEDERVENYLLLANSFDGSSSLTVSVTPVRVVCMNTLSMALSSTKRQWRAKHTRGSLAAMEEARRTLGLTFKYLEEFEVTANEMVKVKVKDRRFQNLLDNLVPLPDIDPAEMDKDRAFKNKEEARETITALWKNSPNLDNIRYTAYGVYNAVAEYADWVTPTRNTKHGSAEENRFSMQVSENDLKDRALAYITDQWVPSLS